MALEQMELVHSKRYFLRESSDSLEGFSFQSQCLLSMHCQCMETTRWHSRVLLFLWEIQPGCKIIPLYFSAGSLKRKGKAHAAASNGHGQNLRLRNVLLLTEKIPPAAETFSNCCTFQSSYRCDGTQPLYLQTPSGVQPSLAAAPQMLRHLRAGTCRSPLLSASMVGCLLGQRLGSRENLLAAAFEAVAASTSSCFHFRHTCNVHLCLLDALGCNPASGILGFPLGFDDFIRGGVAPKGSAVVVS